MRILDRYIINSIVVIFLTTVLIFCCLYVLIDVTTELDEFINHKIPIVSVFKYYLSFFPVILVQVSSIACLIATLLTFATLNNNNEVIALRASGLNFWQITKPAIIFSLIVGTLVFWINERYVPVATQAKKEFREENLMIKADRIRKRKEKIKNLTFYGLKNRLYFIDSYNPNTYELYGITIIEHDNNQNIKEKVVALEGKWTGIAWKFYKCQVTSFAADNINNPLKVKVYEEKLMDIQETPEDFLKQRLNVDAMNIQQLAQYIGRFANSGATKALNNLRVDLHHKIAYPMGNFVIVLMGLPFALMIRSRKGGTFTTIGIAIGVGFLYYVANAVTLAFGKGGLLPPILSAWAAPLIFVGIAIAVIEYNF